MKRSALQRRTPLRTVTPGLKRSRLKASAPGKTTRLRVPRLSVRTAAYNAEFAAVRPFVLRRCRGVCEACGGAACSGPVSHVHHRLRRAHGGGNDETNLIAVSAACHERVHANPTESYRRGLLVRSWDDPGAVPVVLLDP